MSAVDPYARAQPVSPIHFLHHLNPLAKVGAVIPAMVMLIVVRDLATPLLFIGLALAIMLIGVKFTRRNWWVLLLIPVMVLAIGLGFSIWVDATLVSDTTRLIEIGPWTLFSGAVEIGMATGLRLGAILTLALLGGLTTNGPDLVRASVQQLRVPYRIGYTALAAYRFVPRFGYELSVIRAAHRVRGHHGGSGPFARLARAWGYVVPLLAGAIRHAERVALAMDSRAFGAYPDRTERYLVPFRVRDWVFMVLMLAATAGILIVMFPWNTG